MNRRKLATVVIAAVMALGLSTTMAETEKAEPKKQTTCPVMQSQPIEKSLYIDVKGKRIYVCCKGCINQIKANPDKYIKRLEDKGVVFEKAPDKKEEKK